MMEIYNEDMVPMVNPDLTVGHLKQGIRIEHHDAVEGIAEVWHYETLAEYPNGGKDVRKVIDVPGVKARAAWDEEIPILIYVPYTSEELAEKNKPSIESRVETVEGETAELREALDLLLSGVTE